MDDDKGAGECIDSARINSVIRRWINAIDESDSTFFLNGPALKLKRLEQFRAEPTVNRKLLIRPWNYSDFLERLSTFTSMSWFAKPAAISALECARCGWTNDGNDMISCGFCKSQLWHYFDDFNGSRLRDLLTSSHAPTCGWSNNFSPVSFLHFPMTSQEKIRDEYLLRVQSNSSNLSLSDIVVEIDTEMEKALESLVDGDMTTHAALIGATTAMINAAGMGHTRVGDLGLDPTSATFRSAVYLSLCGWACPDEEQTDSLSCMICSRVVRKQQGKSFNPIHEHKFYCPWAQVEVDGQTDVEEGSPGWKLTLQALILFVTNTKTQKRVMVGHLPGESTSSAPSVEPDPSMAGDIFKRVKIILDSSVSVPKSSIARLSFSDVVAAQVAASGVKTMISPSPFK
jgi:hypothetical protein